MAGLAESGSNPDVDLLYDINGLAKDAPRTGAVIRFDPIDISEYFGATRVTEDGAKALPTTV